MLALVPASAENQSRACGFHTESVHPMCIRSDAARQATVAPSGARSALRLRAASASPSVSAMLWESCSSWRSHLSWARGSRNGSSKTAPAQAPHVGSGVPCVLPSPSLCLRWARRTGAGAGAREPPRALPQPSSREALRTWLPRWRPRSRVGSAACRLRALAPRGAPQSQAAGRAGSSAARSASLDARRDRKGTWSNST